MALSPRVRMYSARLRNLRHYYKLLLTPTTDTMGRIFTGTVALFTQNLDASGANQVLLSIIKGGLFDGNIVLVSPKDGPIPKEDSAQHRIYWDHSHEYGAKHLFVFSGCIGWILIEFDVFSMDFDGI